MKSIKIILSGIFLILASLFFMGISILNSQNDNVAVPTAVLLIIGAIVCLIGLFFTNNKKTTVLALAIMFFIAICILNAKNGGTELLSIVLFISGCVICLTELLFTDS